MNEFEVLMGWVIGVGMTLVFGLVTNVPSQIGKMVSTTAKFAGF